MDKMLGNSIKELRIAQNMTQSQLAEKCGVTVSAICHLERDGRDIRVSTLSKMSEALNVPMVWLFPQEARWVAVEGGYKCSYCHSEQEYQSNYCPHCGARMVDNRWRGIAVEVVK